MCFVCCVLCVVCCRRVLQVAAGGQHTLLLVSLIDGDQNPADVPLIPPIPANALNAAVDSPANGGQQSAAVCVSSTWSISLSWLMNYTSSFLHSVHLFDSLRVRISRLHLVHIAFNTFHLNSWSILFLSHERTIISFQSIWGVFYIISRVSDYSQIFLESVGDV